MAVALDLIDRNYTDWSEKLEKFKRKILEAIASIPDHHINGSNTIFSHINVSFKGISGETLATALDMYGISVSTTSACSSHHTIKHSHVLEAMGLEEWIMNGAIRISMGYDNTEEEIDYFIKVLLEEVNRIRNMS